MGTTAARAEFGHRHRPRQVDHLLQLQQHVVMHRVITQVLDRAAGMGDGCSVTSEHIGDIHVRNREAGVQQIHDDLPGTSGFIGEFLTLLSAFKANTWVAILGTTGVILSAAYALYLYRRVIFGELDKPKLKALLDLSPREIVILAPLVLLTIFYGIYPAPVLDVTGASVKNLVANYEAALKPAAAMLGQ